MAATAWQVANLRVTAFPVEPTKIDALSWWIDLLGYPPETQIARPKIGERQEEGEYEGRKLLLQVKPERVDWTLAPIIKVSETERLEGFPLAGPFPDVVGSLRKLMLRWLPRCPPIARLAFGGVLTLPVENRETGYRELARFLPDFELDPESSDFFYQINRPRASTAVEGLRINRLSKWSVMLFQPVTISVSPDVPAIAMPSGSAESACRLELDVNTVPSPRSHVLPDGKRLEIFEELLRLGEEITQRGDVR